ncbi:MAG: ABC transporter permease [Eubacteriales bacterium]|nr:ABC transporter permease [Eubacteriales bacterium]
MLAIWKREVQNYFLTPIGYVFMGVFLLCGGVFFFLSNIASSSSSLETLFGNMIYLFMLVMPILTMRLLSEEKRTKSDQLLLTSPLSITQIVVGKFLAAATVLFATMVVMLIYVVIICCYSTPYPGMIVSNYLGFFLVGCCYVSIGVLMSALTENQVSAAVLTFGANLLLQIFESLSSSLTIPTLGFINLNTVLSWMSLYKRYYDFTAGILSFANVLYYVSFCFVILFLAVRVIDKRRWSEG